MKRFVLTLTALTLFSTAITPAAYAVDFDELRRENRDKDATQLEELRRGHQDGIKAVDFDKLRRENRDKDAVDFDRLRRENRDKDAVDFALPG